MIGIIDYDAGNIKSVEKALAYIGEETIVSRDPEVLLKADKAMRKSFFSLHSFLCGHILQDSIRQLMEQRNLWIMVSWKQ